MPGMPGPTDGDPDEGLADGAEALGPADEDPVDGDPADGGPMGPPARVHRALGLASLALSALSIVASLVVVTVLRRGLGSATPDHAGLLGQVNPWYGAAIVSFLAALSLLVTWGLLGLLRRIPFGQGLASAAPAGLGLAFVAVAWALSLYRRLD